MRLPGQDVAEGGPVARLAVLPVPVRSADGSVPLQGDRDHEEDGAGERGPVERVVGVREEGQQPVWVEVGPEPSLQHRHHQVQTAHYNRHFCIQSENSNPVGWLFVQRDHFKTNVIAGYYHCCKRVHNKVNKSF